MRRSPARLVAAVLAASAFVAAPAPAAAGSPAIRASLEKRVAADPDDPAARRLLGRVLLDAGDVPAALAHLAAAVELDPLGGAARYDYGRALLAGGDGRAAAREWREVLRVAPESDYAADAEDRLDELPAEVASAVEPAGHEVREFPGPPAPDPTDDLPLAESPAAGPFARGWPPDGLPLFFRLETGVLYNSNVALAPTSRQLAPGDRESFQLFAAPEIEWAAAKGDGWAAGPLFYGHFSLNEPEFDRFNLQSYTPGLFFEAASEREAGTLVPRLEYRFTLDEFAGETFGRRHGVTGRLTALHHGGDATTGYVAVDHADFADDGALPEVTSADGFTYATGAAHEWALDRRFLSRVRLGVDLDRLDARGSDYAYYGGGLSGEAVVPIVPTVELKLTGGWGYRVYDRFEFEPSRDEHVWRAGTQLRKWFTENLSAAAVVNYQRFDSENPLFASDRTLAGLLMEYRY